MKHATENRYAARVLLIGTSLAKDSMEVHVLDALKRIGAEVSYLGTQMRIESFGTAFNGAIHKFTHALMREPERLSERRVVNEAVKFAPDLIVVLQGNHISPKTIGRLRGQLKCPIVCWCQDHLATLGRQYMLGANYDVVFLKDRYMLELFSSMIRGTSFRYLPEACNPRVHKPIELTSAERARLECDVMIYGSLYYYRQAILEQLDGFNWKFRGYVPGWFQSQVERSYAGGEITLESKARAVCAARISLNPLHYGEVNALNCRAFELAGCGAFQLVTAKPVLREHFTPGVEVEDFRSVDELIDKIRYYLERPEQAAAIGRAARLRAHREHTYENRMRELLEIARP